MIWLIVLCFLFFSFLLFTSLLQALFLSDKAMDRRLKHFLKLNDTKPLGRQRFDLLVQMRLYKLAVKDKLLSKQKDEKLSVLLGRAGIPLKPEEYILFQWISTALGGGLFFLIGGKLFLLLIGAAAGYALPRWWVEHKQRERLNRFNDGLHDMIVTIIGSLRAGFSFAQALRTVVDEAESPIREEIDTLLKELQYGSTMEDALLQLKERMPSEDLDLMIQAVLIQRQIGGNLAVVLDTMAQTIRDRNTIQRQIRTLTAQGRLSGLVIGALPLVLGLLIYIIQPAYIEVLFRHSVGQMMLIGGFLSGGIGFLLIRKMTRIEV